MFETVNLTKWLMATTSIILLLSGFAIVVRVLSSKGIGKGSKYSTKGRQLRIAETLYIDAKHKLCLIRKGNVQHLVLLGGQNPLYLESEELEDADAISGINEEEANSIGFLKALKEQANEVYAEKPTKVTKKKSSKKGK